MTTTRLGLPLITGNMSVDVVRDFNALAEDIDLKVASKQSVEGISTDLAAHKADATSHIPYGVLEGLSASKTISIPSIGAYKEGLAFSFKNNGEGSPTTPVTINLNGLGVKPLLKSNLAPFTLNLLKNGSIYTVRYNGASFVLQGEGAYGNAIASDLLSGKTAGSDVGDIVGTMTNRGAPTLLMSSASGVPIPSGYYSGGIAKLNVVAGELVAYEDLTGKYRESTSMGKVKEVRVEVAGTYRITFELSHNNTGKYPVAIQGQIYKNGSPYGWLYAIAPSGSGDGYGPGYYAYTQDLYFEAGSLCQLYISCPYGVGISVHTRQLRLSTGMPPLVVKIL